MARRLRFTSQGGSDDRRVTWLELFFDLVYVAAFGEIALRLEKVDAEHVLSFSAFFAAAWFSWLANTLFAARYGNSTRIYALATLVQMLALGAVAAAASGALQEYAPMLALAYAVGRGALAVLYFAARGEGAPLARRLAGVQALTALLWLASAFAADTPRLVLWGLALLADLMGPLLTLRRQGAALPHEAHLPERLGQLYIVVLGVVVTELVKGAAQQPFSWLAQLPPALGLVAVIALWQAYFESTSSTPVRAAEQQGRPGALEGWLVLHLPLMGALTALGAGLGHTAAERAENDLVGVTLGLAFLALAALRAIAVSYFGRRGDPMTLYLALAGLLGGALAVWMYPSRLWLSLLVAALCLGAPLVAALSPRAQRVNDQLQEESAGEE